MTSATNRIHATAVVEPGADIDPSVTIGPFAVIGPNVRIGADSTVGSHTVIEGYTTIGQGNRIGHFASVGGAPQDMKYAGEPTRLEIGDRNVIREFTTIHTGTAQDDGVTRIGNDNWIMAYVHIAHDCTVGNHTVFSSNAQIAGHVSVG
ncbi:MAG: acyl-ACP--UDP-N-acetylglucosamine O-acyltransferase, partial [Janthinobacterium lividum]